ncbi:MAG: MerR family transcriptional regulator [Nitrospirae bacterium]|nr:MAG: MerR family transcriptional regulator [Nitrospirota bacterium]
MVRRDRDRPLYAISVVAEMLRVHPQTLRLYEREGLIRPQRVNNQRLYSDEDLEKLSLILELTRGLGVNKAGVEIILRMREKMIALQRQIEEMLGCLDAEMRERFRKKLEQIMAE